MSNLGFQAKYDTDRLHDLNLNLLVWKMKHMGIETYVGQLR